MTNYVLYWREQETAAQKWSNAKIRIAFALESHVVSLNGANKVVGRYCDKYGGMFNPFSDDAKELEKAIAACREENAILLYVNMGNYRGAPLIKKRIEAWDQLGKQSIRIQDDEVINILASNNHKMCDDGLGPFFNPESSLLREKAKSNPNRLTPQQLGGKIRRFINICRLLRLAQLLPTLKIEGKHTHKNRADALNAVGFYRNQDKDTPNSKKIWNEDNFKKAYSQINTDDRIKDLIKDGIALYVEIYGKADLSPKKIFLRTTKYYPPHRIADVTSEVEGLKSEILQKLIDDGITKHFDGLKNGAVPPDMSKSVFNIWSKIMSDYDDSKDEIVDRHHGQDASLNKEIRNLYS